mmetsp:Transcript_15017/g.17470  ORF Transcript_15017/g.17470 Transcript_15017/m.17470 type:complete len:997 (+) Transcript_15017:158-3148(+)
MAEGDSALQQPQAENAESETQTETQRAAPKPFRMLNMDGLRGLGVIIVIFYHLGYQSIKNAWLCISIFFSCSGLLITSITIEAYERKGTVDIFVFWSRRVARLFPALFLTLIAITISQKFRYDDGLTFQREKEDMLYAATFLTNYNLVYNNEDDYFDDFAAPSITRHMWTLSIEEQYYIFWPLLIFAWTYAFGREDASTKVISPDERHELSPTMRRCMWSLVCGELIVILTSYFSSWTTIDSMGMSAAYYSTWCRMGDIACGGLTYLLMRLHPQVSRRYKRDPTLAPMSFRYRVILEMFAAMSIIMTVCFPMIKTEVDDMLPIYFAWLRLPFSLAICFFTIGATIQLTEPLPKWAYFSKITASKSLVILGVCSYGIYLNHWPLIVIFGDPNGSHKQVEELMFGGDEDDFVTEVDLESFDFEYHFKNLLIILSSVTIGLISFFYFEKNFLTRSRKASHAWKTIVGGFFGMSFTIFVIWVFTKDLAPPIKLQNDSESIFGMGIDDSKTRIVGALPGHHDRSNLYFNILDSMTRGKFDPNLIGYTDWESDIYITARDSIVKKNMTVVVCKSQTQQSPCQDWWHPGTKWAWLESPQLCGDYTGEEAAHTVKCDEKLLITDISVEDHVLHHLTLQAMIFELDAAFPNYYNRNSIARISNEYNAILSGEEDVATGWGNPMKMTIMGESVAEKIGMFWSDAFAYDVVVKDDDNMPNVKITNMAHSGSNSINFYVCNSEHPDYDYSEECNNFESSIPREVLMAISLTKPDVLTFHDSYWGVSDVSNKNDQIALVTDFEKILAFNLMLEDATSNGVKDIIYLTLSANDHNKKILPEDYWKEMHILMKTVETLRCSADSENSIGLTVVDWSYLTCPTLLASADSPQCPSEAHGFSNILPDGQHPEGKSGDWLSKTALALAMADVAMKLPAEDYGDYSTWEKALTNTISTQLLEMTPPDNNPPIEDLIHQFHICPQFDLSALEGFVTAHAYATFNSYGEYSSFVATN